MKNILFLILYLGGGVGLYRWVDFLRPVGEGLNGFYSWVWLDSGSEFAIRQFLSFSYASFFIWCGWRYFLSLQKATSIQWLGVRSFPRFSEAWRSLFHVF
ncbi:hypothetical protein [Pseudomonas bijieensis]|uniref:hypothetical protein n=1 Tax=Pseudomonas bijieensis TaxID=2681983 RepID=UPI001E55BBE1|nr:hypothetical protein [Pseudomonas bijieensis]MCD9118468.1 hypothetical protein [Pseudomonas bijieensis]